MSKEKFDVIIVGAGPAGCSAAIELGKLDYQVAIVDKDRFPRDKICGDALSLDVINQLERLSPALASDFRDLPTKTSSHGVSIYAPGGQKVDIPFIYNNKSEFGYLCRRVDFDFVLYKHLEQYKNITTFQGMEVLDIHQNGADAVTIKTKDPSLEAPLIIAADGAHSIVSRKLTDNKLDKKHYSAGLRVYYENVHGFNKENYIELHFFKDILPGYLWIFPLPDGRANVGIGMLSSAVSRRQVNLRKTLDSLLKEHPVLKDRFSQASPLETVQGFGLPLGSKRRPLSGNNYLLTGDAAGLIDPFSGEGIANAIRSGRVAAEHADKCFKSKDFSAKFNKGYDKVLYSKIWHELRVSHALQRVCKHDWLFNFIIKKANKNQYVHQLLIEALANVSVKQLLLKPSFYFKLMFK